MNNNNDNIKCICGINFEMNNFKKHFRNCQKFLQKFEKFDYQMQFLLKSIVTKEVIHLVRFLLKRYIHLIDKKILKINQNSENNQKDLSESEIKNIENNFNEKEKQFKDKNRQNYDFLQNSNLFKSLSAELENNNYDFNQEGKNKKNKKSKNIDLNPKNNFENNLNKKNSNNNNILGDKDVKNDNEINNDNIFDIFKKDNLSNYFNNLEKKKIFQSENVFVNKNNNINESYENNRNKSDLYKSEIRQNNLDYDKNNKILDLYYNSNTNKKKKGKTIKKSVLDRRANYEVYSKMIPKLDENDF